MGSNIGAAVRSFDDATLCKRKGFARRMCVCNLHFACKNKNCHTNNAMPPISATFQNSFGEVELGTFQSSVGRTRIRIELLFEPNVRFD